MASVHVLPSSLSGLYNKGGPVSCSEAISEPSADANDSSDRASVESSNQALPKA